MKTIHKVHFTNSQNLDLVDDSSISLVVTSPPYPMIEMWDNLFSNLNPLIKESLENKEGSNAFKLMHNELDTVWSGIFRKLIPGGIVCINIGDATRTINKNFQLFSNHSRIIQSLIGNGFQMLPEIIWRKQTNAPNKFMGSGMLPPNAYVTLEHEFIIIARKSGKREFKNKNDKSIRNKSSYFWEERNTWFSDLWDFKGTDQNLSNTNTRSRSAAFPFELAYRLINMFSVQLDTILDPFVGTGTTTLASIATGRNSVGYEIELSMKDLLFEKISNSKKEINKLIVDRVSKHKNFVEERIQKEKVVKYTNQEAGFPVITQQETKLKLNSVNSINLINTDHFEVSYED
ncbi:MAG: Modification methylase MjaI [Candidatus Heimdallarchaeota archaeon LC_3]|nr:MAG: Modification methylase MjaI [Candidatus Heimdallarchaeota archaeon LC_3]